MESFAIQQFYPMVDVEQADLITRHFIRLYPRDHGRIDTIPGIANANPHPITTLVDAEGDDAFAFARLDPVDNGIFHQRLNQQARYHAADLIVDVVDDGQLVAEARLFDGNIILDLVQLSFDINLFVVF